jgi:hypothetical protein
MTNVNLIKIENYYVLLSILIIHLDILSGCLPY